MSELGAQLKHARESRGLSLHQIATATKISPVALESLERGELSKLPGGIFSRAFVRAYAIEVGLNPEEVVARFLVEHEMYQSRVSPDVIRPEVTQDDKDFLELQRRAAVGLRIAIVMLLVLIVAAVAWWRVKRPGSSTSAESVADAPVAMETGAPAVTQASAPAGPEAAAVTAALRIEVAVSEHCWVQVKTDGTLVPARVFGPGERASFEAQREIVLQVGSAGAVSLTLNGRPGRSLGRLGEVRTVTISSTNVSDFFQSVDEPPTPTASATDRP